MILNNTVILQGDGESAPDTPPPEFDSLSKAGDSAPSKTLDSSPSLKRKQKSNGVGSAQQDSSGAPAISIQMDLISSLLFVVSVAVRMWKLDNPKAIV